MLTTKNLSLVEQKKLQWAKEKEEMMGLYGLWGKPRNNLVQKNQEILSNFCSKNSLLPPILTKSNADNVKEFASKEESETSGYLSDSPKCIERFQSEEPPGEYHLLTKETDPPINEEICDENQKIYWSESEKGDGFWAERKILRNNKNENWLQRSQQNGSECLATDCNNFKMFPRNKNYWFGTPESVSSDDGSRLRWGDRGIGVGHLWNPVINPHNCRLPQVNDHYRNAPKWVGRNLKNHYKNQSEVLIINHPDDGEESSDCNLPKNYILGQNAPIPPEVIEERELKRKKALEHQNAIKKQLEERAIKRKQEKEKRLEEEKLEEERIKREQEIERIRYEEEQLRIKEKEEMERKREMAMKEAIEMAEKRAREEKKKNKNDFVQVLEDEKRTSSSSHKGRFAKVEKIMQPTEVNLTQSKKTKKFSGLERSENRNDNNNNIQHVKNEQEPKTLKDSSSQFEEIKLSRSFQVLNVNGRQVDGGLTLMMDNSSSDGRILLPPEGVQFAFLMSPRNTSATANRLLPPSPSFSESARTCPIERTLTPSKYRLSRPSRCVPNSKSTQTDFGRSIKCETSGSAGKPFRKLNLRRGTQTGLEAAPQKSNNIEKIHRYNRNYPGRKYRSKLQVFKLDERPKWGINRPSVQYKTQSEKDPNYHKRMKEKLKNVKMDTTTSSDQTIRNEDVEEEEETIEEKELNSVVRLLELQENDRDQTYKNKLDMILQNGFRMNSNLSSPVFMPIDNRTKSFESRNQRSQKLELESEESLFDTKDGDDTTETEDENTIHPEGSNKGSSSLNPLQLEAIEKISSLRECIKNLQKDYLNSRSSTPFSGKNIDH